MTSKPSAMRRWLQEPLVHFLLIGATLFLGFSLTDSEVAPNRIIILQGEVDSMAAQWQARHNRAPSTIELDNLIDQTVRTSVLANEARALGLDRDDPVVQRRLAQKVEFLFSDLAQVPAPTDEELHQYLQDHRETFTEPVRISFQHIFFSPDAREAPTDDADAVLIQLHETPELAVSTLGDRTMLAPQFDAVTKDFIGSTFGNAFADALMATPMTIWQGPIQSGYGMHLVRIHNRSQPKSPALDDVRDKLTRSWVHDQQVEANEAFYQSLLRNYVVTIGDKG